MKKILIIANLEHASPRIPSLSEGLINLGYEITILTTNLPVDFINKFGLRREFIYDANLIEVEYSGDIWQPIRCVLNKFGFSPSSSYTEQIKSKLQISDQKSIVEKCLYFYEELFGFPDTERKWLKPVKRFLLKNETKFNFDFVVSSSPYPTSHIIAKYIKQKFQIPWIADFRDTWSDNPNYPYSKLRLSLDRLYEKYIMSNCDHIITVSFPYKSVLSKLHSVPTSVIPNGFQGFVNDSHQLDKFFSIVHTGSIYWGKQDPQKFLIALSELIDSELIDENLIKIEFYGKNEEFLDKLLRRYGLTNVVVQKGYVSRNESRSRQLSAQVLLFFNWEDEENNGGSSLKLYEYLKCCRPILATGGSFLNDDERVLTSTGSGIVCPTISIIKDQLIKMFFEFKSGGEVQFLGNIKEVEKHSYLCRAYDLHDIFSRIRQ